MGGVTMEMGTGRHTIAARIYSSHLDPSPSDPLPES